MPLLSHKAHIVLQLSPHIKWAPHLIGVFILIKEINIQPITLAFTFALYIELEKLMQNIKDNIM